MLPGAGPFSTDVGDVSWLVPTAGLGTATRVPGTAAHTWQAIAAGGVGIGNKGMLVAAKALAMTAVDLYTNAELIAAAQAEHERRVGPGFEYVPLWATGTRRSTTAGNRKHKASGSSWQRAWWLRCPTACRERAEAHGSAPVRAEESQIWAAAPRHCSTAALGQFR